MKAHVPTVLELAALGHAKLVAASEHGKRVVSAYMIDNEGQTLIYAAMKLAAAEGMLEDERRIAESARARYIWDMCNENSRRTPTINVPHDKRARQKSA